MTRTTWNHIKNPDAPLRWRKPRLVRVNLTGAETDAQLDRMFAVMALAPAHTFEVLAANIDRIKAWADYARKFDNADEEICGLNLKINGDWSTPVRMSEGETIPNVGIGTLCRTQAEVDHAAPIMLSMPNARPWLRLEPGERISVSRWLWRDIAYCNKCGYLGKVDAKGNHYRRDGMACRYMTHPRPGLHLIELSGQTGPDAKPMHPDYARQIRDECKAASVEFRFASWGEWVPYDDDHWPASFARNDVQDRDRTKFVGEVEMYPAGPRKSGRILDGVTHDGQIGGGA